MHTYRRVNADEYQVGQWLPNPDGHLRFNQLFSVPTIAQAFVAVNTLNGGTRISTDALQIIEKNLWER